MKAITSNRFHFLPILIGSCLMPASASAAVFYSDVLDILIPTNFNGVYLNIGMQTDSAPSDGSPTIQLDSYSVGYSEPASWDVNLFFGGIGIAYSETFQPFVDSTVSNRSQILNVAYGTVIEDEAAARTLGVEAASFGGSGRPNNGAGSSHFDIPTLNSDPAYSAFTPGEQGYIAFVLNPGAEQLYGWMRVTLTNDGTPGTIHDWAISSDEGFTVGMIPEPTTALLGGIGMLLLLRRRR